MGHRACGDVRRAVAAECEGEGTQMNDEELYKLATELQIKVVRYGAWKEDLIAALVKVRDSTVAAAAAKCDAVSKRKPSYWKPGAVECASEVRRMFHVCCICDRQHDEPCV